MNRWDYNSPLSQAQLGSQEQSRPSSVERYMKQALCLTGCLFLLLGCGQDSAETKELDARMAEVRNEILQRHARPQFVDDNTAFALDLYHQLRTEEGNLFFSPYSISTALAMTFAGARGETERQMAEALHFNLPQEKLHAAFGRLQVGLNSMQHTNPIQLSVANSLWPAKGWSLRKEYVLTMESNYTGRIMPLDYSQTEAARQTINRWVEEHTQDKIKDLVKRGLIGPQTVLVLANAIYFKARWETPFQTNLTRPEPFHVTATKTVTVPMMNHRQLACGRYVDNEVQVLELPYMGDNISMVILLPKEVDGLTRLEEGLTLQKLNGWVDGLDEAKVDVWLPKFNATSEFSLAETLKALGMVDAFGPADFSGMFEAQGPCISAVVHQAFVEVNEKGTEAAAATGVTFLTSAFPSFRADHPFLFLIRDRTNGSILFLGRMVNPSQSSPL